MIAAAIAVVDDRYGDERCGRLPSQWMTVVLGDRCGGRDGRHGGRGG